jgi:hypothetical protein
MTRQICHYCGCSGATSAHHTYQTFHNGRVALTTNYPISTIYYHPECEILELRERISREVGR